MKDWHVQLSFSAQIFLTIPVIVLANPAPNSSDWFGRRVSSVRDAQITVVVSSRNLHPAITRART